MTITLASIQATQTKLANMIADFQKQPRPVNYAIPEATIELRPGEHYAGIVLDVEGQPSHHVILLPGEAEEINWRDAQAWALQAEGALPTRQEQALLFANLRSQFKPKAYWSAQQHDTDPSCAWCQSFYDGGQSYRDVSAELRARAVRRLVIE